MRSSSASTSGAWRRSSTSSASAPALPKRASCACASARPTALGSKVASMPGMVPKHAQNAAATASGTRSERKSTSGAPGTASSAPSAPPALCAKAASAHAPNTNARSCASALAEPHLHGAAAAQAQSAARIAPRQRAAAGAHGARLRGCWQPRRPQRGSGGCGSMSAAHRARDRLRLCRRKHAAAKPLQLRSARAQTRCQPRSLGGRLRAL
jgi:hypothetical protein